MSAKTLQMEPATARKEYTAASPTIKRILEESFGKDFFSQKITDRIKTWEDAALEAGIDPVLDLPYQNPTSNRQKAANAFFQLDVIAEVLREGVILDWTNSNQAKYYAWFNDYTSGSGFSFYGTDFVWTNAYSSGGARLCVDTREKAAYFGTQFLSIFNQFLNPIN